MRKIKIRLPATVTDIGPALHSVALALRLYVTVEISRRNDTKLELTLRGEGADAYETPLAHPVVRGMSRLFQRLEHAALGATIVVQNDIPFGSGLGAEAAMTLSGLMGANDLLDSPCDRKTLMRIAADLARPESIVTAVTGGVGVAVREDDVLLSRSLPIMAMKLVIVWPQIKDYRRPTLPEQLPRHLTLTNIGRTALLLEALRDGHLKQSPTLLNDPLLIPQITPKIPSYDPVVNAAMRGGAYAVIPVSGGPALMAFADERHEQIAEDMRLVFNAAGIKARTWVLPIDTQGIILSAMQSAG